MENKIGIEIGTEETCLGLENGFSGFVKIGVQTFYTCVREDKEGAEWYVKQVETAIKTYSDYVTAERDKHPLFEKLRSLVNGSLKKTYPKQGKELEELLNDFLNSKNKKG